MDELHTALELEPDLRNRLADEPDFQQLRGNSGFRPPVNGLSASQVTSTEIAV